MKNKTSSSRRDFIRIGSAITAVSLLSGKTVFADTPVNPPPGADPACPALPPESLPEGYNILFIVSDQEKYFDHYPFPVPGRERLAKRGVRFTNHHICSSVCTPSRSVLYTGLHMPQTGMFDNPGFPWMPASLDPTLGTLGHIMQQLGYYPAYKGKWHLNSQMSSPGNKISVSSTDIASIPRGELTALMQEYGFNDYTGVGDIIGHSQGGYLYDELTASQAISWLRGNGRDKQDHHQPWLLAVNLVNPHDVMYLNTDDPGEKNQWQGRLITGNNSSFPAQPPDNALYRYRWPQAKLEDSRFQSFSAAGRPPAHLEYQLCNGIQVGTIANVDRRWRKLQDYYFNCIRDNDTQLVRILNELDALGLSEKTIIVFTSDHGELCGAHQMNCKGTCTYKQQVRVPLFIVHPDFPGGKDCHALTCHLDIIPTLAGLTGRKNTEDNALLASRKGADISPLLFFPERYPVNYLRDAILYCYDMLMYSDATYIGNMFKVIRDETLSSEEKKHRFNTFTPDLKKRGGIRMIFDGKYKFTRYFSLQQHHIPETPEILRRYNDLELYDLQSDPQEMHNLAADKQYSSLVDHMNDKLNRLYRKEIGTKDDGHYIPPLKGLKWSLDPEVTAYLLRD
ncbi:MULTISPECIES: sulfatase-like hydrolase/transferase [Tatumella]|uniref:Sulfatase-like hydrolase/transferase n=1 Tax=Tatumella punctata TaxID=399969 RepID=A0ABW1VSB1_9GAMM|nr:MULTISPECIES: sulfatase-like hydrolase/transferase [unclassified Tatumella]MBS0857647.1 sulfatase-like hydrolase/transferase [Tatumella sp. JGM16]MBS0914351.1 sulfatase-like hydrolase/transferase [Tatumella sp. JGM91]